jgi:hypothetical protein
MTVRVRIVVRRRAGQLAERRREGREGQGNVAPLEVAAIGEEVSGMIFPKASHTLSGRPDT